MNFPPSTPCKACGSPWCQSVCRFKVTLHPAMSHAAALQTARDLGMTLGETRAAFAQREPREAA